MSSLFMVIVGTCLIIFLDISVMIQYKNRLRLATYKEREWQSLMLMTGLMVSLVWLFVSFIEMNGFSKLAEI